MSFVIKVILAGDGSVGKTALRETYLGRGFQTNYLMTIGADFAVKTIDLEGRTIKFQIWDLAGQDRFTEVRSVYYKGAHVALLLFDVTRPDTFDNLPSWIKEIWTHSGLKPIPIVILGNKADLREIVPESMDDELARKFCRKLSERTEKEGFLVHYLPTSAKTGLNVNKSFDLLMDAYFDTE
ncbi:MAG: GTP-binding protein [Candidatus Hodarchaeales archaeon]|jgi:small GTP-binding protein